MRCPKCGSRKAWQPEDKKCERCDKPKKKEEPTKVKPTKVKPKAAKPKKAKKDKKKK